MDFLFTKKFFHVLFSIILLTTIAHAKMGAVIIAGQEFHHQGYRLQQVLKGKKFDGHLTLVDTSKIYNIEKWADTPLGKAVSDADHYEKLILIITAHGSKQCGAHIYWESLLKLLKFLETKSDEILIHIETCFSGDGADILLSKVSDKVKVVTTSACCGRSTRFNVDYLDWDAVSQLFTGQYYHSKDNEARAANTNVPAYNKLNSESTISDLGPVIGHPCSLHGTCDKLHIKKGGNEKLSKWHLLPRSLSDGDYNTNLTTDITDTSYDSQAATVPFDEQKTVEFDYEIPLGIDYVNILDKPNNWQLRTVENEVKKNNDERYFKDVHFQIKKKNLKPYATILKINDGCDTTIAPGPDTDNGVCNHEDAVTELKSAKKLTLAYYHTREPYKITGDTPFHVDPNNNDDTHDWAKPVGIAFGVLGGIVLLFFICYCCCRKKKRQPRPAPHGYPGTYTHSYGGRTPATQVHVHCNNVTAKQKTYAPSNVQQTYAPNHTNQTQNAPRYYV